MVQKPLREGLILYVLQKISRMLIPAAGMAG
jgi:hypothetical protein